MTTETRELARCCNSLCHLQSMFRSPSCFISLLIFQTLCCGTRTCLHFQSTLGERGKKEKRKKKGDINICLIQWQVIALTASRHSWSPLTQAGWLAVETDDRSIFIPEKNPEEACVRKMLTERGRRRRDEVRSWNTPRINDCMNQQQNWVTKCVH